uniref:Protein krueppel n=1 Tax=Glossina pallidipes TaxID=7398 RepID=A0A1B0AHV5_GLOPL
MCEMLRKILYYENVLEFKVNTKSSLQPEDVNNWQLCRTCLCEIDLDDSLSVNAMVIDTIQEKFLNIKEMLQLSIGYTINLDHPLPSMVCKSCVSKITKLYYFTVQIKRAENVLKSLYQNLNSCEQNEPENNESLNPINVKDEKELSTAPIEYEQYEVLEDIELLSSEENYPNDGKQDHEDNAELLNDIPQGSLETYELVPANADEELFTFEDIIKSEDEGAHLSEEETPIVQENKDNEEGTKAKKPEDVNSFKKRLPMRYKHKQPRVKRPLLTDLTCSVCSQSFYIQRDLVQHVQQTHPSAKAFKCRDCGQKFTHMQSLSRHMNTHKTSLFKYECKYCIKTFARIDGLIRHHRTHTDERPYGCDFCDKTFKQRTELNAHALTHVNHKMFACNICDRLLSSRNGLYLHKKNHENRIARSKVKLKQQIKEREDNLEIYLIKQTEE